MKAFLFSFLALGLTGVIAAPAPAPESELSAKAPCNLLCRPGFIAIYDTVSKQCKCIVTEEQKCLRETICISTHHPVWNAKTKKCSCEPYDFEDPNPNNAEFICIAATTCSPGSTPIWHPETESCNCEKVAKREATEEFPDPKTCPTIRCGEGTTPKYIPKLGRCICETNPEPVPDPKSCPTIRCADGYTPKYIPGKSHCICEKTPEVPTPKRADHKCPLMKCSAGYKVLYNASTKACSCVPDPTQCTGWICIAEKRPIYDLVSKKCGCQWIPGLEPTPLPSASATPAPIKPCANILCIAEKTPKVNDAGVCECVWIPGLEPGSPTTSYKRNAAPQPLPPATNQSCRGLYCIAEKHVVYNSTTMRCECVWIPGLEPGGPKSASKLRREPEAEANAAPQPLPQAINQSCRGLYCIAEKHVVYNSTTMKCECVWIPGLEPGGPTSASKRETEAEPEAQHAPPSNACEDIVCIAEMRPVYNPSTKTCGCEWIPGLEPGGPTSASKSRREPEAGAKAPRVPSCDEIVCIAEMRPVYNPVTKRCGCEWIPGFGPTAASKSRREPEAEAKAPHVPSCDEIVCIAEMRPVYNPVTKTCGCEWIPGFGPTAASKLRREPEVSKPKPTPTPTPTPYDPLNCRRLKVYCEGGDHYMVYDISTQQCRCPLLVGGETDEGGVAKSAPSWI